jgi:plastocyanin
MLIIVFAAAGAACSSSSSTPTTPSTTSTGASTTVSIPSGASGLTTTAFGANPLTVAVGTTVTWINNDSIAHNSVANNGTWTSTLLNPGQTFQFRFATAGTFPYRCTIHPNMVGTVTVQ